MNAEGRDKAALLIVDDTPTNLEILVDFFADAGFEVYVATSGEHALTQVKEVPPDLILLDVMMPGIDGFETCRRLKASAETKDIPVIFMTALSDTSDKVKGLTVGAVDYVTKPLQQEEVLARVNTHLTIRRLQRHLEESNQSLQQEIVERKRTEKALHAYSEKLEAAEKETWRLLLNVLPESVASKLKNTTGVIAESFPNVSVLFADIVNFTELSTQHEPEGLVKILNDLFSAFDTLVEQHALEKIKTIGDAYMVVGGAPTPRPDHAQSIADLALGMLEAVADYNEKHKTNYSIRVGINSGPVVAGVIGTKKFSYDLWGDTVNVASRMESHGLASQVQVSERTYELLRDQYVFEDRGEIKIKGKQLMKAYLLKGRPETNT